MSYHVVYLWKCSMCICKECLLCFFGVKVSVYQLIPLDLECYSMPQILVVSLFGRSIHCWQWDVKIPYDDCVAVDIFFKVLQDFPDIFRWFYVSFIYVYKGYILMLAYSLKYYVVTFCLFYGFYFEVYFVWYKYCTPTFLCPFSWNIFFYPFTLLYISFVLWWASCRQHICRSCFLIHSAILCLLTGVLNAFMFKVIIDRSLFIAIFFLHTCISVPVSHFLSLYQSL